MENEKIYCSMILIHEGYLVMTPSEEFNKELSEEALEVLRKEKFLLSVYPYMNAEKVIILADRWTLNSFIRIFNMGYMTAMQDVALFKQNVTEMYDGIIDYADKINKDPSTIFPVRNILNDPS